MQKIRIKYLITVCAGGLIGLLSLVRVAHAETIITDGYLRHGGTWTKAESPYIVESPVIVPGGFSLTVEPGVSIVGSSTIEGYDLIEVRGSLILNGQADQRISVSGFGDIYVSPGNVQIKNSDITLKGGVGAFMGTIDVSNSTISGADNGINVGSSVISVTNSRISNNLNGVYVQSSLPAYPVFKNNSAYGMGGIGNALLAQSTLGPSFVTISNSSLTGNSKTAVDNRDISFVKAENNWWGTENGPSLLGDNMVKGLVNYDPWLLKEPVMPVADSACCSSVLFIPGLEGTRLYRDEKLPIIGKTTNQLWEPNRNADVEKLYLNSNGSSTDATIYSGGPVGKALGLKDIYGEFMSYLDSVKEKGMVNEWKAFGYDWRKPIVEVVAGSEKKSTTTESLIQTVNELASRSRTGKVTLIAHSNGGLVAKYLVKTLVDMGKSDLIDSVISVAVPYLGTPEAIADLLHGYNQSIAGGVILSASTARGLGINMASAYSLLPSREYFSKVFGPTIAFASTTVKSINNGSYPKEISTYEDQSAFVVDSKNSRIIPEFFATTLPIKGNNTLAIAADILHGILDPFSWPTSIARWSIVGWGEKTTKGVTYSEATRCEKTNCVNFPTFSVNKTIMGDGTVVAPSAAYNAGDAVSLDLDQISKQEKREVKHANILGASSTMAAIGEVITGNTSSGKQVILDKISKIPGVTIGEPDYSKEPVSLVLSTHSPVELHVYDSKGNHVGLIPKPASLTDVEDGLYTFFDDEIPGASFDYIPDPFGGYENYVYLPDDNGEKYSVVINGIGLGEFTYEVERVRGDEHLDKVQYSDMPVTPLTIATTTITARVAESAPLPVMASSTPALSIDLDGNGSADFVATSTTKIDEAKYFKIIRTTIGTLAGNLTKGKAILKRLDKIDDLAKKGKLKQVHKVSNKLDERIGHMKLKKISEADRSKILNLIDLYVSQYE